jgi:nitrogen fixation/metabolism regulation signal transduction histidine kinase
MRKAKSLKDLLLIHELTFILLVALAGTAGVVGIHLWDQSSQESQRINLLVQEIQQTRGDLYRQIKEVFDAYFLADVDARSEYDAYTASIENHFLQLGQLAIGDEELAAIKDLKDSYTIFVQETTSIFNRRHELHGEELQRSLNSDLESGIFQRYELVSARAERLLTLKQHELQHQLEKAKRTSIFLFIIPILFATLLLLFSRFFLKRAIVRPIDGLLKATSEISAGHLDHKAPEVGAAELAILSRAINQMAEDLAHSQEALIRTEKQAAQGLLVPMLAHNIRNPLSSIRATAQVTDNPDLDPETRESLQGIISTVDRLERWTGSLLSYLHPLKPQLNSASLKQAIMGACEPLQQKLREKSMYLELPDWDKQNNSVFTDEHMLEQALYNLLLNAIEAAPAKSTLEITIAEEGKFLRLLIADQGPGMPFTPDPHATSPGPTTKRFGTGLGIPFVFKVCETLSIDITFSPRKNGGTLIELMLPRHRTDF